MQLAYRNTVALPLTSLTGRPFTLEITPRISDGCKTLSESLQGLDVIEDMVLRREAHYSAMLDGKVREADSLFHALTFVLNRSHDGIGQEMLPRMTGSITAYKSAHSKTQAEQLLRFISEPQFPPLLKGAVAHAFILATQPFTVGNGRIARLLNFSLCVHGGYPLQHSLSETLYRHREDYVQAVRGLFLPPRAGSLTAFVEFILESLLDGMDSGIRSACPKLPGDLNRMKTNPSAIESPGYGSGVPLPDSTTDTSHSCTQKKSGEISVNSPIWDKLRKMENGKSASVRRAAAIAKEMLREGILVFNCRDWTEHTGMPAGEYKNTCEAFLYYDAIERIGTQREKNLSIAVYRFKVDDRPRSQTLPPSQSSDPQPSQGNGSVSEHPAKSPAPASVTTAALESYRDLLARIAPLAPITNLPDKMIPLLSKSSHFFSIGEWATVNTLSIDEARFELNALIQMGLISRQTFRGTDFYRFRFLDTDGLSQLIENEIHAPLHPENYGFWTNLALLEFSSSPVIRRGAIELYRMIQDGISVFSPALLRLRANLGEGECRNVLRASQKKQLITATGGITRTRKYVIDPIAFEK